MAHYCFSIITLAAISAALTAPSVQAQMRPDDRAVATTPGQYNGSWTGAWVGADGQVYRGDWQGNYNGPDGRNQNAQYSGEWRSNSTPMPRDVAYRSNMNVQRDNWLIDCRHRLDVANHAREGMDAYRGVCDAWLGYYERNGWARDGYGFSYAIPVSLVSIAPRPVAMSQPIIIAPRPHYKLVKRWQQRGHWHSYRVRVR